MLHAVFPAFQKLVRVQVYVSYVEISDNIFVVFMGVETRLIMQCLHIFMELLLELL